VGGGGVVAGEVVTVVADLGIEGGLDGEVVTSARPLGIGKWSGWRGCDRREDYGYRFGCSR
jgi:hypothetical protein